MIRDYPARVTVKIDGLAASAAVMVALAGDVVKIQASAYMMVHNPMVGLLGYFNVDELKAMIDELKVIKNGIVEGYMAKTKMDAERLSKLMNDETWMTADEAHAFGFIDQIGAELKLAACFDLKQLGFRNAPRAATVSIELEVDSSKSATLETESEQPDCYCTGCAPELSCPDCPDQATCINPTKPAAAAAQSQAPAAEIMEVVTMDAQATTPANGAAEIVAMAITHGCIDKAAQWIKDGKSVQEVGIEILNLQQSKGISAPASDTSGTVDMGSSQYSFQNAMRIAA